MVPTNRTIDPISDAYGALYRAIEPGPAGSPVNTRMVRLANAMTEQDSAKAISAISSLLPLFKDKPEQRDALERMRHELSE